MGLIRLEGLEFFAHHGYHHEEQKLGNRYSVDIELQTKFGVAAEADELSGTVNYEQVYALIAVIMRDNTKLLEHIAHRINKEVMGKFPSITEVKTTVSKFNPPLKGICRAASVVLTSGKS